MVDNLLGRKRVTQFVEEFRFTYPILPDFGDAALLSESIFALSGDLPPFRSESGSDNIWN